jgi:hypothetical protein
MKVAAFEGIVVNGQIQLNTDIQLPDNTKVYVIVPGLETRQVVHVISPRLVRPEQAADFKKENPLHG